MIRPRPLSRTSTILESPPPSTSSWSVDMPKSSSSRTSWSDVETEIPTSNSKYNLDSRLGGYEAPLIDFGDDDEKEETPGMGMGMEMNPGDKLRMLLRQMEAEVRETVPAPPPPRGISPIKRETEGKAGWRDRRLNGSSRTSGSPDPEKPRRDSSPSPERARMSEEEESPPTPPMRITNPYLYGPRRVSGEREWIFIRTAGCDS